MSRQYICTRPKLVSELIRNGHKPKVEPSPWKEGKTAWIFDRDEDLEKIVNEFYKGIGKRSPFETVKKVEQIYTKRGIEVRA